MNQVIKSALVWQKKGYRNMLLNLNKDEAESLKCLIQLGRKEMQKWVKDTVNEEDAFYPDELGAWVLMVWDSKCIEQKIEQMLEKKGGK